MDETTTAPTTLGRAASASSGDGQLRQGADTEPPSRPQSCDSRSGAQRLLTVVSSRARYCPAVVGGGGPEERFCNHPAQDGFVVIRRAENWWRGH